ncbi:SAM-dependent methyltransferase [Streptomyces johnsoniae]|uniref:SAM-dependent methyltransferase n=1 Tax=Streptomyces johnsoniae TaxID=3075532 RepID=A0ABU2S6M0_9ACTN|nr:SAM-dependent methyltransferase [Streptomyces sp. DSM 41886]MDT0444453.1 SAM-dependent methyltransferase [Streptomyces sp. DSM 41886]
MTDEAPLIDTSVPHSARIWNYWLGGRDNYEVDRVAGDHYRSVFPGVVDVARASRGFLLRSVRYLAAEAGIRQFLDIGTGLPTAENVHEAAQIVAPESRIVYVDNDALVIAHARALLTSGPPGVTDFVRADLHDPETVLSGAARTLDLSRPVGLVLSGVLGHVAAYEEARSIVGRLLAALPAGSHLTLNDGTGVFRHEFVTAQHAYNESGATPYHLRTPAEIAGFFTGLDLVEPGVVSCPGWRPVAGEPDGADEIDVFGGVGRKS